MEAAANGIGCVDAHTGGVLPFSPFLRQGTFADRYRDKERCRKKKAILAGAQPLNSGHEALLISFSNVRLDQTQPVDVRHVLMEKNDSGINITIEPCILHRFSR